MGHIPKQIWFMVSFSSLSDYTWIYMQKGMYFQTHLCLKRFFSVYFWNIFRLNFRKLMVTLNKGDAPSQQVSESLSSTANNFCKGNSLAYLIQKDEKPNAILYRGIKSSIT